MKRRVVSKRKRSGSPRERIVQATIKLLAQDGRDQVTTRSVAAEAGVQAPAIYRLFGDKQGLLDAVAEYGFSTYLEQKPSAQSEKDVIKRLRVGWDVHVGFGLQNPALFCIMYGAPHPERMSQAETRAYAILRERTKELGLAGLLRVPEDEATAMMAAAASGTVFAILNMPEQASSLRLSVAMREATINAIVSQDRSERPNEVGPTAILLRALLPKTKGFSRGERSLLEELLDRLSKPSE